MVWYEMKYGNMIFMGTLRLVTWEIINYIYMYKYKIKIEKLARVLNVALSIMSFDCVNIIYIEGYDR